MRRAVGSLTLIPSLAAVAFGIVLLLVPDRPITAQPVPSRTPEPPMPTWSPPRTPTPESTHPSSEEARRVIERSDQAMNQLRSLTIKGLKFATREMDGTPHGEITEKYMFPDRYMHMHRSTTVPGPTTEIVVIGRHYWNRSIRAEWSHNLYGPIQWPSYPAAKLWWWEVEFTPVGLQVVGPADVAGRPCWQIAYDLVVLSFEGPFRIHIVEWIDTDSSLIRQRLYQIDDPWGDRSWVLETYDYVSPVSIEPPTPLFQALLPNAQLSR